MTSSRGLKLYKMFGPRKSSLTIKGRLWKSFDSPHGRIQRIPSGVGEKGPDNDSFVSHERILQSAGRTSLENPLGPIASRGDLPVFLRKTIATCDFPGVVGVRTPVSPLWARPWALESKLF